MGCTTSVTFVKTPPTSDGCEAALGSSTNRVIARAVARGSFRSYTWGCTREGAGRPAWLGREISFDDFDTLRCGWCRHFEQGQGWRALPQARMADSRVFFPRLNRLANPDMLLSFPRRARTESIVLRCLQTLPSAHPVHHVQPRPRAGPGSRPVQSWRIIIPLERRRRCSR